MNTYTPNKTGKSYQKKMLIYGVIVLVIIVAVGIVLDQFSVNKNTQQEIQEETQPVQPENQALNMVSGVSADEAAKEVQKRTDMPDIETDALAHALTSYLEICGLPDDTPISINTADADTRYIYTTFTIGGNSVSAKTTDDELWEISDEQGHTVSYSFANQDAHNMYGTDQPIATNTVAVKKILGDIAGQQFEDAFAKFCQQQNLDPNTYYIDFSGNKGVPTEKTSKNSNDSNVVRMSTFTIYNINTQGSQYGVQVSYASNPENNTIYIFNFATGDITNPETWIYTNETLTKE